MDSGPTHKKGKQMQQKSQTFRLKDKAQARRLGLLCAYLELTVSKVVRDAIDEYFEQHKEDIAKIEAKFDAREQADAELAEARAAAGRA
jgi:predicted transcriptional regulator YheO